MMRPAYAYWMRIFSSSRNIVEEWDHYLTFATWFESHYVEGHALLALDGNFSPETCQFIPQELIPSISDGDPDNDEIIFQP
jgi:hypothetical protein